MYLDNWIKESKRIREILDGDLVMITRDLNLDAKANSDSSYIKFFNNAQDNGTIFKVTLEEDLDGYLAFGVRDPEGPEGIMGYYLLPPYTVTKVYST